jgi:hypothetical protein
LNSTQAKPEIKNTFTDLYYSPSSLPKLRHLPAQKTTRENIDTLHPTSVKVGSDEEIDKSFLFTHAFTTSSKKSSHFRHGNTKGITKKESRDLQKHVMKTATYSSCPSVKYE